MEISATRKSHFNAAHRLHVPHWSAERNKEVFGVCNNENYHGHNYILEATVTGEVNPETGYLMDLKELKEIIHAEVEERFDHKNLNLDTEEFRELNPTVENIAVVIWRRMRSRLSPELGLKVRLYETERNFVEYEGR